MKLGLLLGAAVAPLLCAGAVQAQSMQDAPTALSEVIVTGEPELRNRTEDVSPTLSYDREYFQRFEPLTVGDALRRTPSVTFLSDVLESDGARLRGLDPAYTQILIDGERVPGAGVDRSFFVDRIPAELIERVEIVRSGSANRSGDAVAGAVNIVLRDAYSIDGGYLRAGGILLDDGEVKPTVGAVWGGEVGPGRLLVGANVQGRRNPKQKHSTRYEEPGGDIDNTEVQTDTRNGTDYSFNAVYDLSLAGGELSLSGLFVRTDRLEDERSVEYAEGIETDANIQTVNENENDILTDNLALNARYSREMLGGETKFRLGYAAIEDEQNEFEDETVYDDDDLSFPEDDVFESKRTATRIQDEEWSGALSHARPLGGGATLEFGVQYVAKTRDTDIRESEAEVEIPDAPAPRPAIPGDYSDFEVVAGGLNAIEETRIDPYVMVSGETGEAKWEAGLRYETTDVTITDETADPDLRTTERDYGILLPSASLRYSLNDTDRLTVSVARTVRRPNFNHISPAVLEGEYGDNDFLGNPNLSPETAWGGDLGFERRLGRRGVVGINFFYRDITDLIEITNTGAYSDEAQGNYDDALEEALDDGATQAEAEAIAEEELTSYVLTAENVGDGKVWGVEFDLSTPLDVVGLPNTGVYFNYSWLDSEIEDFAGTRRFNGQSDYVVSLGFTHDIPTWGAAFGASWRRQGDAYDRIAAEEVRTSYGDDLEVFIEKRFAQNVVVRLTGSNLLDASKDEVFDKFDTIGDQLDRDYDEFEVESENAGPVYQLVARVAF